MQPGAVHQHPSPYDVTAPDPHGDAQRGPPVDPLDLGAVPDLGAGRPRELPGDPDEVADPGGADVYGREPAHLRLVLGDLGGAQLPHRDPVLPPALYEGVQPGSSDLSVATISFPVTAWSMPYSAQNLTISAAPLTAYRAFSDPGR